MSTLTFQTVFLSVSFNGVIRMFRKFFAFAAMTAILIVATPVFALSIANLPDGVYSLQPKCAPDKELSVQNHATNWGANVIIDNINLGWQKWKIQRIAGTDLYSIIAVHSNLALDVANARAENGVNIATWPFLGDRQNQYRIWDAGNGYYVIQANIGGNFVLDVVNAENRAGANVWSYGFNNSDAQLWRLVQVRPLSIFQSYSKKAAKTVPAYVMPDLAARNGNERVDAGDNVTVLREEGNAYLVRYPVSGGTKTRWVNKNEIFGGGGSYDNKVREFVNNGKYKAGTRWKNCFNYAAAFTNYVFGKAPRQGQIFYSADEIRNGDVVHVNAANGRNEHWIVVLYRNGNRLTTIEGNWTNQTVRYTDSVYWIQNGVIYSNNEKPFRAWDCGYHFQ